MCVCALNTLTFVRPVISVGCLEMWCLLPSTPLRDFQIVTARAFDDTSASCVQVLLWNGFIMPVGRPWMRYVNYSAY